MRGDDDSRLWAEQRRGTGGDEGLRFKLKGCIKEVAGEPSFSLSYTQIPPYNLENKSVGGKECYKGKTARVKFNATASSVKD